jgi:hypothetical protein
MTKGTKIEIQTTTRFGKKIKEIATIVAVHPITDMVILDNGMQLHKFQLAK